ncbi:hypothetical protein QTG56_15485 [Rossellomorea sp. AcN35-11]|nr:hypothetical protein QTG56_15485 [Rossellomorea sp. AcN35-11]
MIQHRDVIPLSISDEEELILASDCSGGIGMKEADGVTADPETVGYYCFRVAVMECLSVGAQLQAVQLLNFTSEDAWEEYTRGVKKRLDGIGIGWHPYYRELRVEYDPSSISYWHYMYRKEKKASAFLPYGSRSGICTDRNTSCRR